ncbi:MAG TPA: CusA/CzcA family heavy metal efflux RND transporter [Balneola sp.]|jgi:copper/silver efflux system protein|nr:CusA/CzcA family heavy metal efflux RND transporter [Balneola sp.]MAO78053.1 CusA/CzcA family heavy metal efflux RND transporter [Balneola sp.]MBF64054.1 CusA/CzcA family heavy metal efflux RND transporter [Balneola sp.]HBZ37745.1 CusA/CzcA family heavy metal efflux RND transporter [Balneola sp.]|tara:strand:+ start:14075 stop:17161 length:3087 start_codon:yes stop_codon:yes gene_type:complete
MLDAIIRGALRQRLIVLVSSLALLIAGVFVVRDMPVDIFPDLTAPTVTVMTEAHGMAPEEVERLVTLPVETAVNGATGVRRVRSSTAKGISIVWVEFEWGTDIFQARQIVNEKLQMVASSLPEDVPAPIMAPISSIMGEIMLVSVNSENHSELEVRTAADWEIRRRLLAIPGVAQVIPIGGGKKQYQVRVDPEKLQQFNVTLDQVLFAVKASNKNFSGGFVREYSNEYTIRGIGRAYSIEDIEQSVVTERGNQPILIGDVATVEIAAAEKIGEASVDAEPAVIISIQKQPGANTLELTDKIDETLSEIEASLPSGFSINTHLFRQADFIDLAIENVIEALRDGAILVIIILFLFLANFRTTLISLTAIPLALVASIFVLKFFDITINTMTLGGMAIAIGVIVDDAIIDVENVFKRLRENSKLPDAKQKASIDVIFEASKEIRSSIINATLIIMIVFLPLFFLSGVEGRMLKPLGLAYIVSIGASLIIAMTVTPAMCYYLLRGEGVKGKLEESWFTKKLKSGYENVLDFTLQFKKSILLGTLGLFIVAMILVPFLGRSFLPEFNEGTLVISTVTIPGTSLDESNEMGTRIEKILLAHPGIISTSRRTGRAELDEHAQGVNASEIDAKFEVPEGSTKEEMLNEIRADLSIVPGTNITIGQPIGHRIDHMLSGTRANIAVKIFGSDLYELRSKAEEVRAQMENITGVVDLSVEQQQNVPQIQIKPDRRALARYGITIEDLSEMVDVAFAGEVVSQILEEDKMFDLTVRFDENHRGSMDKIRQARFNLESGVIIPLSELASIESKSGPNTISRENVQRKIVVSANVSGRDLRSTVDEIRANVETNVSFPQGYFVEYGGQFESAAQATRTISLLSIISILGIYLLLYLEFGSLKTALLVMVNLPFALIGGIFTVMFTSGIVSIASLVGFITLFGIATRNGILMVSHYQQLLSEGKEFLEAIRQGSLERLNPILMTALTAGLALIPLAIAVGEPGNEIQSPMAQVILGGLISSTLLNMIVIPALFAQFSSETMN